MAILGARERRRRAAKEAERKRKRYQVRVEMMKIQRERSASIIGDDIHARVRGILAINLCV
jgi:hypothetical protein